MGIWEFCFYKFRHPDYQFDHLFHGCHPLYGEEFRLIREKLLPGWLMVVQLFITISLILRLRPFVFILGHSMIDASVQIFQQMKTLHADWLCCKWLKESSYLLKPFYMEDSYH